LAGVLGGVEVGRRLVPQQGAAFALPLFDARIFLLQVVQEKGEFGFVARCLLAEFHDVGSIPWKAGGILPCLDD